MIKEDKDIKGMVIGKTEHKISQFADDTELFQDGNKTRFEETIRVLDDFGNQSGLKINIEITIVLWLGSKINSNVRSMPQLNFE